MRSHVQGRPLALTLSLSLSLAVWALTPSCGGGGGGATKAAAPAIPPNTIMVGEVGDYGTINNIFNPSTLVVTAGTTVTWRWATGGHTVESGTACTPDGVYSSGGVQSAGHTMTYTFAAPGTYSYYCTTHCGMAMTGTVTVN